MVHAAAVMAGSGDNELPAVKTSDLFVRALENEGVKYIFGEQLSIQLQLRQGAMKASAYMQEGIFCHQCHE